MKILLLSALMLPTLFAQGGGRGGPLPAAKVAAPFDPTGYWVSEIVDEWRFRVTPQKGDIPYMPLNAEARRIANAWDPDKDASSGNPCKAYGAIGVMQRPGRLHITWADDNTLKMDLDAGGQTRLFKFGPAAQGPAGEPSGQGNSTAQWQVIQQRGAAPSPRGGTLKVVTTNLKPGYLRKNGVPYSDRAVQTEYINYVVGQQKDEYLVDTSMVDDPVYLTGPFIRTYTFKKESDGSKWEATPCWNR
jgi:hypothetical protein